MTDIPSIRGWFAGAGVAETSFVAEEPCGWSVGGGTFTGDPQPLRGDTRLLTFTTCPLGRS